jgi:hypothetical protein
MLNKWRQCPCGGEKRTIPVFTRYWCFEVTYYGAKSAGTVPEVFGETSRNISGARSVLKHLKVNLAIKTLLERSIVFWFCQKCAGTVLLILKGRLERQRAKFKRQKERGI